MSPTSALAGASGQTLTITANSDPTPANTTSFLACSTVLWVGSSGTTTLATNYMAGTPATLVAAIPAALLASPGTASVKISTPAPGGGTSQAATFTITAPPTPTISSVFVSGSTPPATSTLSCRAASITLQVNGTNFVSGGSVVNWSGLPRPTIYVQPPPPAMNQPPPPPYLTATIPYTDLVAAGTFPITVSNGSALSSSVNFSVTAATLAKPTATSLSASGVMAGSGALTLNVIGTNFSPCSVIEWNGTARTTTYLSPTQLSTPVLASDVSTPGSAQVTVFNPPHGNPPQGGGTSNPALTFTISALSIGTISVLGSSPPAASTPYCSPAGFTLDVTAATGTTFTGDTVVNWNGSPRPTTFVSATQLTAEITYADTASLATANVTVSNSASTSLSQPFTMTEPASFPVPAINRLSPSSTAAGGPAFVLSVIGTGFLPCSKVQWNGPRTTTFASVNGLTAPISASDIGLPTSVQVTVITPTPSGCTPSMTVTCGGPSNPSTFTVFPPVPSAARILPAAQVAGGTEAATQNLESLPLTLQLISSDRRYTVQVLASADGETEIAGTPQNIFVRDTCAGAPSGCEPSVTPVSVGLNSSPADGESISPSISADGRYVAFLSSARNLVDSDTNGAADVFVRDTCAGAPSGCVPSTQRISVGTDGTQADGPSTSATISASGRYVTFKSSATNLGSLSTPGLYLRDTCAGADSRCMPSTQAIQ